MTVLKVIVDNNAVRGLRAAWGLSILVERDEKRVLFDTGPDAEVLCHNMGKLGIKGDFDALVISHNHWDHTGGMSCVENRVKSLCLPAGMESRGRVCRNPTDLGFAKTTGTLGHLIKEQGLIVEGDEKIALLVGCSHPGVDNLARRAYELMGSLDIVIGGFHLLGESRRRIEKIARTFESLDISEIYGIHCTGDEARRILKEMLGERVKEGYAGLEIHF